MGVFSVSVSRMSLALKVRVADDVDLADLRATPFLDVEVDAHAVVGQVLDLRIDAHRVLAAAVVLVGEVLRHFLERRAVEGLARRQPDIAERFLQVLGLDVLVALDLDALERRPFEYGNQQRIAVAADLDVAKETGRVQRPQRLAHPLGVELVADIDRQVVEYRAFGDALQSLDLDVADRKLGGVRRLRAHGTVGGKQDERCETRAIIHAHTAVTSGGVNQTGAKCR